MQPRRTLQVLVIVSFSAFVALFLLFLFTRSETIQNLPLPSIFSGGSSTVARLHVLIVATSANLDLCRLLLSLSVLSYPQPVLIDWAGTGEYNASDSHLAKITGTLRYLEALPTSKDGDMILMLDGFDIFMQLGPDVLLKRYFQTTAAAKSRLSKQFGAEWVKKHRLHDSILFGPDKTCWPPDPRRAACWVVPESSLDSKAFGPVTDQFADPQLARPLWLNSGTIMGPASDMRTLFQGTMEKINKTFDPENELNTSDQLYFSDLWADQEYLRMVSRYGEDKVPTPTAMPTELPGIAEPTNICAWQHDKVFVPDMRNISATDFHMGLDYESRLFQTMAFYENYLAWVIFNGSEAAVESELVSRRTLSMPRDIAKSPKPFAVLKDDKELNSKTWADVAIGVNAASGHIFPVLHFTGNKTFRDEYWTRMWFFPYAERLLNAAAKEKEHHIGKGSIEGVSWRKDVPYIDHTVEEEAGIGAWIDEGEHKSWKELCGIHEPILFSGAMPSRPPEEPEPEPTDPCAKNATSPSASSVLSNAASSLASLNGAIE